MKKRKDEITLKMTDGSRKVTAIICDDLFAVHKSQDAARYRLKPWAVTHGPTCLRMPGAFRLRKDALRFVEAILPLTNWLVFNSEQIPQKVVAVVRSISYSIYQGKGISDEDRETMGEIIERQRKADSPTIMALQTERKVSEIMEARNENR